MENYEFTFRIDLQVGRNEYHDSDGSGQRSGTEAEFAKKTQKPTGLAKKPNHPNPMTPLYTQ